MSSRLLNRLEQIPTLDEILSATDPSYAQRKVSQQNQVNEATTFLGNGFTRIANAHIIALSDISYTDPQSAKRQTRKAKESSEEAIRAMLQQADIRWGKGVTDKAICQLGRSPYDYSLLR